MDIWDKKKRSAVMAKIRSKDTKPELIVRRYLWSRGYRYRKNVRGLPGTPDIVLRKYGVAIFVHGCFWHGHEVDGHIMGMRWTGIFHTPTARFGRRKSNATRLAMNAIKRN